MAVSNIIDLEKASPVALGRGYNTFTGDFRGNGLLTPASPLPVQAQTVVYRIRKITSYTELRSVLNVSGEASFGFFASAKADYAKSTKFNSYSHFIHVQVLVTNSLTQLDSYRLTPEAAEATANMSRFFGTYGDTFVRGILQGGELFAIIQIAASSQAESESIGASLSLSFGLFGSSATFSAAFQRTAALATEDIIFYRNGGLGPLPTPATIDSIAAGFPADVLAHPANLSAVVGDYKIVDNTPQGATWPNYDAARVGLSDLSELNDKATEIEYSFDYISRHLDQFPGATAAEVNSRLAAVQSLRRKMRDMALAIRTDPTKLPAITSLDLSSIGPLPKWITTTRVPVAIKTHVPNAGTFEYEGGDWIPCESTVDGIAIRIKQPLNIVLGVEAHWAYRVEYSQAPPSEIVYTFRIVGGNPLEYKAVDGSSMLGGGVIGDFFDPKTWGKIVSIIRLCRISFWIMGAMADRFTMKVQAIIDGKETPIAEHGEVIGESKSRITAFRVLIERKRLPVGTGRTLSADGTEELRTHLYTLQEGSGEVTIALPVSKVGA